MGEDNRLDEEKVLDAFEHKLDAQYNKLKAKISSRSYWLFCQRTDWNATEEVAGKRGPMKEPPKVDFQTSLLSFIERR